MTGDIILHHYQKIIFYCDIDKFNVYNVKYSCVKQTLQLWIALTVSKHVLETKILSFEFVSGSCEYFIVWNFIYLFI